MSGCAGAISTCIFFWMRHCRSSWKAICTTQSESWQQCWVKNGKYVSRKIQKTSYLLCFFFFDISMRNWKNLKGTETTYFSCFRLVSNFCVFPFSPSCFHFILYFYFFSFAFNDQIERNEEKVTKRIRDWRKQYLGCLLERLLYACTKVINSVPVGWAQWYTR